MNRKSQITSISLALGILYGLSGCNLELQLDDKTRASLDKTVTGVIDSLDQFRVNNETFDVSNATVTLDGQPGDISQLREGMVVSVSSVGTQAIHIDYRDNVEGVVRDNRTSTDGTLDVLGQTVHVDDSTRFSDPSGQTTTPADLPPNSVVEVSGHASGDGEIWATHIEVKEAGYQPGREIEVKGIISELTPEQFKIGNLTVDYTTAQFDTDSRLTLQNGLYVEVKSIEAPDANGVLSATEIDLINEGRLEVSHREGDEQVKLEGIVTELVDRTQLRVDGRPVAVTADTRFEHGTPLMLAKGEHLEIEGYVNADNVLVASRIEFRDTADASDSSSDDNRDGQSDDARDDDHASGNEAHDESEADDQSNREDKD